MPITIDDPQVEHLAQDEANATGRPIEHVVVTALRDHFARTPNRAVATDTDGYRLLRWAVKLVPATKFAVAVGGVAIAMSIAYRVASRSGITSPTVLVFGVAVMFVFMWGMAVFAEFTKRRKGRVSGPALVMSWGFVVLVLSTCFLLLSTFFGQWPRPLPELVGVQPSPEDLLPAIGGRAWVNLGEVEYAGDSPSLVNGRWRYHSGPSFSYVDGKDSATPLSTRARIRLSVGRSLVIPEYARSGRANVDSRPSSYEFSLFPDGDTGVRLRSGSVIEVRRVDIAAAGSKEPAVVWAQVASVPR